MKRAPVSTEAARTAANRAAEKRAAEAGPADLSLSAAELHLYDGGVQVGDRPDFYVDLTGGRDRCVTYCLGERQPVQRRRGQRCPSCYGKVGIRDMATEQDILPAGSRWSYLVAYWAGGWAAAWHEATAGMVRRPPGPGIWIPAPVICRGDFT